MRRTIAVRAACLIGALVLGTRSTLGAITQAVRPVTITVRCESDGVDFALRPWVRRMGRDRAIRWNLAGDVDQVTIAPKGASAWPFANRSITVPRGSLTTPLVGAEPGVRYSYTVTLTCGTETTVVDPDIIVD